MEIIKQALSVKALESEMPKDSKNFSQQTHLPYVSL